MSYGSLTLSRTAYDLLCFFVATCLPKFVSSRLLPLQDHFAFHDVSKGFEGYYTRLQSSNDDSSLIFIFSSVRGAESAGDTRPHFVHFSFNPSGDAKETSIRVNLYPRKLEFMNIEGPQNHDGFRPFQIRADDFALFAVDRQSQFYWLCVPDPDHEDSELHISARLTCRTPLRPSDPLYVPHNSVIRLGSIIPLHWHVFSTLSQASYSISRVRRITREDGSYQREESIVTEGVGFAHVEKNWGKEFPEGWTWGQGFSPSPSAHAATARHAHGQAVSTLAFAGGTTGFPFLKSHLVIYRSPSANISWDFSTPWTTSIAIGNIAAFGPFVREQINSSARRGSKLEFSTLTRRIVLHVDGTKPESTDDWLPLDCPLTKGHGNITARESFSSTILVSAYERSWMNIFNHKPWAWKLVDHQAFHNAAWELGGKYRSEATIASDNELWKSITANEKEGSNN